MSARPGELARMARDSGLRSATPPSLEAIDQRRAQLWTVAIVVMGSLSLALVLLTIGSGERHGLLGRPPLRIGVVVFTAAVGAYLIEKELHLRRLTRLLVDERVLTGALSKRLTELSALATVGKAMNSVLGLDEVLNIILGSTLDLLDGEAGSILLVDEGHLRAVCVRGDDILVDERVEIDAGTIAGSVALEREAALVAPSESGSGAPSAMSVPLISRSELLGVLNVTARSGVGFTEYDLRSLTLFAEHAAIAIVNARLYETERAHVAELVEVDRMKSEFVAAVGDELRTPLTAVIGNVQALRRGDVPDAQVGPFLAATERHGRRLLGLIDEILVARRVEAGILLRRQLVDLGLAAAEVTHTLDDGDGAVSVRADPSVLALGDSEACEQILFNLVDNALTHGRGLVEVVIEADDGSRGGAVRVAVLDRGPGVAEDDVERIFDRFSRRSPREMPGVGLGLYLVKRLAEAQGGSVSVANRPGGGAEFSVLLPAATRTPAAASR